jgi:putative membrane protein
MKIKMCLLVSVFITTIAFGQTGKKSAEKENQKKFADSNMKDDAKFVVTALDAGLYEVQIANFAISGAYSNEAIELAKEILKNQNNLNEELTQLAAKRSITVPTTVSKKHQNEIYSLYKFKDRDFDEAFSKKMITEYSAIFELFKNQANITNDNDLRNLAVEQLHALNHLRRLAQSVLDEMKVKEIVKR